MTGAAAPPRPGGSAAPGPAQRANGPAGGSRGDLRGRLSENATAWLASIAVALLALFLRLWRLGEPRAFAFDETYYAKDAWSLLNFGYVREYRDGADEALLAGNVTNQWGQDPSMIVHPEAGKALIALGEQAFGMNPFGWRVASAIVGALTVLVMCRLARRLTGSTLLGCIAGLLLALDGLHLVLSRLALLDVFLAFWLVCAVACLVADRDWMRARLARHAEGRPRGRVSEGWGPVRGLLFRPWLLAGGVCFGLAVGTKWTALFPMAALCVLAWLWSAGARRAIGVRRPALRSAVADGIPAFVHLVLVGLVVYTLTWTGWLAHAGDYEQALSDSQYAMHDGGEQWPTATEPDATGVGEVAQSLRSLASYHRDMYVFHTQFLDDADHSYASSPWGWLLLNKPVGVDAQLDIQPGEQGCTAPEGSDCLRQVLLLGTPMIWWAGALALIYGVIRWVGARDWRYGLAVVGAASAWLPWLRYDDRPIFLFYGVAILPFTVLALTLTLGRILGTDRRPSARRTAGVIAVGSFLVLVVLNAAWFWPIWTDELLTHGEWLDRVWFRRWI